MATTPPRSAVAGSAPYRLPAPGLRNLAEEPGQEVGAPGFMLFIALNSVLFVRPAEIVPALVGLPIYEVFILACLVVSLPAVMDRLTRVPLTSQPITLAVLGLWVAVVFSHLAHLHLGQAYAAAFEFGKVVLYYMLLVSQVTSAARLRAFLFWIGAFVMVLTALALLEYHGVMDMPSLKTLVQKMSYNENTEEYDYARRLVSTGLFNDPNDLSLVLVLGLGIALYWLTETRSGPLRFLWLLPLVSFGYALALTKSRGGFVALLAGLLTLFLNRFGWKKALPLALIALPLIVVLFGGRQTDVDLSNPDESGQARIHIWREGLALFRTAPVFGIGQGEYVENVGFVAHNSYLHCFTELGIFGGTLFANCWFLSVWSLRRVGKGGDVRLPGDLRRLRPYVMAAVAAYATGLLTLSRSYTVPTIMIVGIGASFLGMPATAQHPLLPRLRFRLVPVLLGVSIALLVALEVFVRTFYTK